ncbi:hypothetical protein I7I48_03722 [Histoplasma ohiense]|nr:hypothetical protein I7I48_03722 [Histoplasma ohiense (nom. inval.)]
MKNNNNSKKIRFLRPSIPLPSKRPPRWILVSSLRLKRVVLRRDFKLGIARRRRGICSLFFPFLRRCVAVYWCVVLFYPFYLFKLLYLFYSPSVSLLALIIWPSSICRPYIFILSNVSICLSF